MDHKFISKEEKYSRQTRSETIKICVLIHRSMGKSYPKAFVNKLSDALSEQLETEVWLDFCVRHKYIDNATYTTLLETMMKQKILISMINKPEKFNRDHR